MVMVSIKRILVPVDFSDCSVEALRYALELAELFDASIDVVYVWEPPYYVGPDMMLYVPGSAGQSLIGHARAKAESELDETVRRVMGNGSTRRITQRLVSGQPYRKICEIAELEDFDLIVMGTHGRTGLSRLIVGSVAEKVIRFAPRPVLTIGRPLPEALRASPVT